MARLPRLLIVDDDSRIRDVIHEYAEVAGYEAEEAADGLEALNLCKNKDYDVIVMDLMMPKMDGFWAVKEIRKLKNIPIFLSSFLIFLICIDYRNFSNFAG